MTPGIENAEHPAGLRSRRKLALAVAALLALQAGLAVDSLVRENPTVDEVAHLPAGLSYWQTGTFKLYPHNPPLVRLLAAVPVLAMNPGVGRIDRKEPGRPDYFTGPYPNTAGVAHNFAEANAARYFAIFDRARLVIPAFLVLGGLAVFSWSRRLYGDGGGLLSLALWVLCPNLLAHGRLITTDVAATAIGFGATYGFWRYLHGPSWRRAAVAGLLLGLAELTKFSNLPLFGLWPAFWMLREGLANSSVGLGARLARAAGHGVLIVALSVLVIDCGYGFEGVGTPLGSPRFEFASRALTRPVERRFAFGTNQLLNLAWSHRVNRFRETALADLPSPLPAYYLIGFDLQKLEAEGIPRRWTWRAENGPEPGPDAVQGYPVYLDGVLRETGWWYYYALALAYKVPEGTLALAGLSLVVLVAKRRPLSAWADELTLLTVPATVLGVMSFGTDINLGLRYVLPIFPYVFASAGKAVPWAAGLSGVRRRLAAGGIGLALAATAAATASIHPHYLAYFNAASGGPGRGSEHLIDSNLDWGQDLVNLREWVRRHGDERVGLAYFGQINPLIFERRGDRLDWFLPPALPGSWWKGGSPPGPEARNPPPPGLYAVSASLVRGLDWRVYDRSRWAPYEANRTLGEPRRGAFSYFGDLTPIDQVGHSIFVYRLSPADAASLARRWPARRPAAQP